MSDADKKQGEPPVETPVEGETSPVEEKPAAPLKPVSKPNDVAIRKEQDRLSRVIQEQHQKLQEVKAQLDKLTGQRGQPGAGGPAQEIRDKLKALQKQIRESIDRSKGMRAQMDTIDSQKRQLIDQAKKMRADLPFSKEEDIEREITKLENQLQHSTFTITEEKKTVARIGTLRASKRAVGEQAALSAKIQGLEEKRKEISSKVRVVSDGIKKLKEEESTLRAELNKINGEQKAKRADVPALLKKKDQIRKLLGQHIEAQKKFRDETNKHYTEWKAYRREADRIAREERARAREAAEEEGSEAGSDDEAPQGAWAQELAVCGDLINYLSGLKAKAEAKASEAKAGETAAEAAAETIDGAVVMGKKRFEGESFMQLGKAKKGGKGKKKSNAAPKDETIKHGFNVLLYYSTIELKAPETFAEVEKSITEVKERKAYYETDPPKPEKEEKKEAKKDSKKAAPPSGSTPVKDDGSGPQPSAKVQLPAGAWANRTAVKA